MNIRSRFSDLFHLSFFRKLLLSLIFNAQCISSDCMDVQVNSRDETEDEITSSYEFLPPLKRFECEDINSKEYLSQESKKNNIHYMDSHGSLSKLSALNFHSKYRKELKRNYEREDPLFDAWMTITGKQRPEFDVQMFKQNNPSVSEKVDEIRAKCGVRLCWIDREEKERYILN